MAVDVLKLKKDAVAKGMEKDVARKASRAELEAFLSKPVKKTAVKKASTPARKPAAKKTPARKAVPAKRTPAAKKSAPAKAPATKRTTAKRPATKTPSETTGRHQLSGVDYTITDDWNPRAGSAVETIFKALKRTKGNVQKAFEILVPNIAEFVGAKKQDGTKRTKADRENMLMYRINRTNFDFAVKTGQHEVATDRAEYGTGGYATTRAKTPVKKTTTRKAATPAKRTAAKAPARRGRPAAKKTAVKRR